MAATALERISLLPPDEHMYVQISNSTGFWNQLKKSPLGKLWVDPQFQNFLGNPEAGSWQDFFFSETSDAENEIILEQLKMISGEFIFVFDKERQPSYIIAAITEADYIRSLDLDIQYNEITGKSFEMIKSTFQDAEIVQQIKEAETPDETINWQTYIEDTLIFGPSREWVEKCIIQLKNDSVTEPVGNPSLTLNIPISGLLQNLIEEKDPVTGGSPSQVDTTALFDALGFMDIDRYSLKVELRDTEMVADGNLIAPDLTKGIFTLFDFHPSELPTVTFIPENIASLEVGRVNLLRFWQEIPDILASAVPSAKPQFDMAIAMIPQMTGIHLEQDLLAHLSTHYLSFTVTENEPPISVIAIQTQDEAAFKTGLETALAAPALQAQVAALLEIEEFLDHTIYTLKNRNAENTAAFGVSGGHLLYGPPDGLRQAIRSQSSDAAANRSFEHSPLVKGLRQHVPPTAFGYNAINWGKNMEIFIRELNQPKMIAAWKKNQQKSRHPLPPPDFSKLPPGDHIASFFNISYQYAETTGNGIHQRIILKY